MCCYQSHGHRRDFPLVFESTESFVKLVCNKRKAKAICKNVSFLLFWGNDIVGEVCQITLREAVERDNVCNKTTKEDVNR